VVAVPSIGRASQVTRRRAAPEADATRDLYERYARQIYAYCHHQLGNKEEAEDATQSTFLNAFRGFQRGVDPEFESAWLYKIAHNVCLTRQRSSFRRRRVEAPGDIDAMQDVIPSPEADADELIRLPEALEGLPAQQRRALLLREWQGLSYKEIAEELELSQAAVETLLFRARRSLAAGLGDDANLAKRVVGKLRAGSDAGSIVALLQTMLSFGGAKVAATVATVAATSVVAATPSARHAVESFVTPVDAHPTVPKASVHKPAAHHAAPRRGVAASTPTSTSRPASAPAVHLVERAHVAAVTSKPVHVRVVHRAPATTDAAIAASPAASVPAPAPVDIAPAPTPEPAPTAETPQVSPPTVDPPAPAASVPAVTPPPPAVTPTSRRKDGVDRGVPTSGQTSGAPSSFRPSWQHDPTPTGRHSGTPDPTPPPTAASEPAPPPPAPTAPADPTVPPSPTTPEPASSTPASPATTPPAQPEQGHRRRH
jgi:RNA polymerase sigma factor (sigma-70 family)